MASSRTIGAPQYMRKRGRNTDIAVLTEVKNNPGLGISDIAARLGWTNGRVDGSVNRLIAEKKVEVKHFMRKGVLVKKVYPIDYESSPSKVFEIPRKLVREDLWTRNVYIYAVSRSTIGLSPIQRKEWELRAPIKDEVEVNITEDTLQIELPNSFADFYKLENSETSLSVIGDSAIITVEATVIPVDVPQIYPEIPTLKIQYVRLEETVEQKTTTYRRLLLKLVKEGAEGQVEFDKEANINDVRALAMSEPVDTSGAKLIKKPVEV